MVAKKTGKNVAEGCSVIGRAGQGNFHEALYQRPEDIWIDDDLNLAKKQSADTGPMRRAMEQNSGNEEKERHVETVNDAVYQTMQTPIQGQVSVCQPPCDMAVYDKNNADAFGVIEIVNPLAHAVKCLENAPRKSSVEPQGRLLIPAAALRPPPVT